LSAVESFFGLLKRERVNRVRYQTREEARADLFGCIEAFYRRKHRHGYFRHLCPADLQGNQQVQSKPSTETGHDQ
jgi:putative transposase